MQIDRVGALQFTPIRQILGWRDAALYALSLGFGDDPIDESHLTFVTEKDQQIVPSQCVVLGYPGPWLTEPALGVNYEKLLHGEQSFTIHRELRPSADLTAHHRVIAVEDKGAEKGAILYLEKKVSDSLTGELFATTLSTLFLRGDGGCGGFGEVPASAPPIVPGAGPIATRDIETLPSAALLYRLNGDINPLHYDVRIARAAGFERPILHGLCTMGLACRAILQEFCGNRATRLNSLFVRFVSPVIPGETVRFEFFSSDTGVRFRARVQGRDVAVLDRGAANFS